MSTNCVRCVVNHRVNPDLTCKSCGDASSIVAMIMQLTSGKAATVTILPANDDFNGQPNYAVIVNQEGTLWEDERFTGDTILESLENAELEMVKRATEAAHTGIIRTKRSNP